MSDNKYLDSSELKKQIEAIKNEMKKIEEVLGNMDIDLEETLKMNRKNK